MKSHKELTTCNKDCRQGRDCYCCDCDGESPHWFEFVLYFVKSLLTGLGATAVIVAIGVWSAK